MTVKPEVRTVLDAIAALETRLMHEQAPDEVRAAYRLLSNMETRPDVANVVDRTIPGPAGPLTLRVYRPAGLAEDVRAGAPGLVWFHGGGWVIGDLETADAVARKLANEAGVVVVSVDYRLAPEHPFPAAVDDAVAAAHWVADNASNLGVDPARLAVGGDSAGGNLAAVVAQQLRNIGPPLRFQLLVYPVTDARLDTPSMRENGEGYFLTEQGMQWCRQHYLGDDGDREDPRVSPLLASDDALTGLPPALVITAEYDPLRDEGEAYGERLRAAGVDTTVTRYDGVIHGFFSMGDLVPDGKLALQQAGDALRRALAR